MEDESLSEFATKLKSREEFVEFLQFLKQDFHMNRHEWQSWTVSDYLEALQAFVATAMRSEVVSIDFSPSKINCEIGYWIFMPV